MRDFFPSTLPLLAAAHRDGEVATSPEVFGISSDVSGTRPDLADDALEGYAVTAAVREWYTEGDLEELEFAVLVDAARGSLDLLGRDSTAPPRRVVLAADVPDS